MITAIIVDDEQKSISTIQKIIKDYCPGVAVSGSAENIITAKTLIDSKKPQLVFLDVEMPFGNGFELLNSIEVIDFEIIFVTAYDQYAITAFKYASVDYLLKPVNITAITDAVARAQKRISDKTNAENYLLLKQNLQAENKYEQQILLPGNNGSHPVKINDISYCLADGSYTYIHLTSNRKFYASKNLKEFEDMLPEKYFFRIHHGHLINTAHIKKIRKGKSGAVIMEDGIELEIAARRKADFLRFLSETSNSF